MEEKSFSIIKEDNFIFYYKMRWEEEKIFTTIEEKRVTSTPPALSIKRERDEGEGGREVVVTFDERRVTHSLLKEKGGGEVTLDHQGGVTHPLKQT